jgi:hypothetical protein
VAWKPRTTAANTSQAPCCATTSPGEDVRLWRQGAERAEPHIFLALTRIGSPTHYPSALRSTHYHRCFDGKGSGLQVSCVVCPERRLLMALVTSTTACSSSTSTSGPPTAKEKSISSATPQPHPPSLAQLPSPTETSTQPPVSPTPPYYQPHKLSSSKEATSKLHITLIQGNLL